MNQHLVSRIAIWLLAIVMLVFGIYHYRHPDSMLVYVPPYLPGGIAWVYFVGTAFILTAIAFMTNRFVMVAGYLLAIMLVIFVLLVHLPAYRNAGDPELRQQELVNILKDTAIAAFALYIANTAKHQRLTD